MNFGICITTLAPMRAEPAHKSEMVSQLLFGELFTIQSTNQDWINITTYYDNYKGWVNYKNALILSDNEYKNLITNNFTIANKTISYAFNSQLQKIPIVAGSNLPFYDNHKFKIHQNEWQYKHQPLSYTPNTLQIKKYALKFLNAPYLWGGKSILGIDCSGLTQVVFKIAGIKLARDAYQQAQQGINISSLKYAQATDLAFFANISGKITHVGILLSSKKIIHASGYVRIDTLNQQGIIDNTGNYTHQLHSIKRIIK